jgi:hypothetical protein
MMAAAVRLDDVRASWDEAITAIDDARKKMMHARTGTRAPAISATGHRHRVPAEHLARPRRNDAGL